jgi:hypothetical protein
MIVYYFKFQQKRVLFFGDLIFDDCIKKKQKESYVNIVPPYHRKLRPIHATWHNNRKALK